MNFIFKIRSVFLLFRPAGVRTMIDGNRCQRLVSVPGLDDRKNDILYYSPLNSLSKPNENNIVVYFGGDIQDYRERMETHRDNKRFVERSLEATGLILSKKFPTSFIILIKANRMYLNSFACYSNFLPCNDVGAPTSDSPVYHRAWEHLKLLLDHAGQLTNPKVDLTNAGVILIGFSKGAVVLNQLVYELCHVTAGSVADHFVGRIRAWYWLDGAHAGSKKTWITDEQILRLLAERVLTNRSHVYAHVTPRQVRDAARPWIGVEEAKFSKIFANLLGELFIRKLHFENEPGSMENHFRVLDVFEPDVS